ncbi:MAG: aspartate carbamoyltransferase [Halobacteria archaeon]
MNDIVSTREMSAGEIRDILDRAGKIESEAESYPSKEYSDKVLALLFFEPSTRTRMSFDTAMKRLGGRTVDMGSVESSSVKKGETLADTVRVVEGYCDAIVMRHPKEGSARLAADYVDKPVINAGDGAGHHPTQTLLDLYTIRENQGKKFSELDIGIMGDLKYGRTVHSLALALSELDAGIDFISPEDLRIPDSVRYELGNDRYTEHRNLDDVVEDLDVLYVTRIQEERFAEEKEYQKVAASFRVTPEDLEGARESLTLMHPLPRVDEIAPEVDSLSSASYFEQAHNGVPVRMAILDMVFDEVS